jgi:hypothetical protein
MRGAYGLKNRARAIRDLCENPPSTHALLHDLAQFHAGASTPLPLQPRIFHTHQSLASPHTGGWRPNRPPLWFGPPCFRTERPKKSENGLNLDKSADFTKNR